MELSKTQINWFYAVVSFFIVCFVVAVKFEFYPILILPPAMLVGWLLLAAPLKLFWFAVFLVPFSVPLHHFSDKFGLILPTEPIIGLLALTFIFHAFAVKNYKDIYLGHPVSLLLLFHLAWMLFTCIFSTMPVVSLKYFVVRLTYALVFFFFIVPFLRTEKNIINFHRIFITALFATVIYVIVRHAQFGFIRDVFITMGHPFYWNHGIYTSTLAFFVPVVLVFIVYGKTFNLSLLQRILLIAMGGVMLFSEIYSFTRAAWVSLIGAAVAWVVLELKVSVKLIFAAVIIILVSVVVMQDKIMFKLRDNEQGSTRKSDLSEHFQSISNVKNDPSNLERINRWNSAIRMFEEKPWAGFGPGTYQFKYAPYQKSRDMTVISTNFGLVGHAHSEYLGPLAEMGFVGAISWVVFFLVTIYRGICLFYFAVEKRVRALALMSVLGLLTYYIHGVLNSYIDYDKIAVPLYVFTAIIVALDINNRQQQKKVAAQNS